MVEELIDLTHLTSYRSQSSCLRSIQKEVSEGN